MLWRAAVYFCFSFCADVVGVVCCKLWRACGLFLYAFRDPIFSPRLRRTALARVRLFLLYHQRHHTSTRIWS